MNLNMITKEASIPRRDERPCQPALRRRTATKMRKSQIRTGERT